MELKKKNNIMRKWLREHPLINISALCRYIKYDRGNFSRFIDNDFDLSEENIIKLETILNEYGYEAKINNI